LLTVLNIVDNDIWFIKLFNLEFDFSSKFAIAIEGDNVYVVWIVDIQDNNDVFFSKSIDGGQTFSTPDNISNNHGVSNVTINVNIFCLSHRLIIMYMFHGLMYTRCWEILLTTSINGGKTFDKPKNISNNDGVSQQP